MSNLVAAEPFLRLSIFVATAVTLIALERTRACRAFRPLRTLWVNVALFATNTLILRLIAGSSLVGISLLVTGRGWGALGFIQAPQIVEFVVAIVLLDFVMYLSLIHI